MNAGQKKPNQSKREQAKHRNMRTDIQPSLAVILPERRFMNNHHDR